MIKSEKMSKRLEVLFLKTKLLCFGRYALEVPKEAELILGDASFPSTIEITKGKLEENDDRILRAIKKIKKMTQVLKSFITERDLWKTVGRFNILIVSLPRKMAHCISRHMSPKETLPLF